MQARDFCYWLQGYFELAPLESLSPTQVDVIKNHLNLVFKHEIDPKMGDSSHQAELNQVHHSGRPGIVARC